MEIDVFTIVMGVVFLLAIFGPLVYFDQIRKNRGKKVQKALVEFAKSRDLAPDMMETWSDKGIGIHKASKSLMYINTSLPTHEKQLVDLYLISSCRVLVAKHQVVLIFDKRTSGMPESVTLFDDAQDDPLELGFHKVLAQKWAKIINELIGQRSKRPQKAA